MERDTMAVASVHGCLRKSRVVLPGLNLACLCEPDGKAHHENV